jgi:hypothetical protein
LERNVTPKLLYRVAATLLALFAALHTYGFAQIDPTWGIDALIAQLQQTTFVVQGQTRTYWDFYYGFGLTVTAWQLVAALAAWELGGSDAPLPLLRWGLVGAMAGTTWLSWRYFFPAPLVFSVLVTICLALAAWRAQASRDERVS